MPDFEAFMHNYFANYQDSQVKEAMAYALFAPGKRFRPKLIFAVLDGCGIPRARAYHSAMALEMIHNYSLIHDDLPAMDDDDLRRGRAACHIAYGEAYAILAGDALLTESFKVVTADPDLTAQQKLDIIALLSQNAGVNGMIYGQYLDLKAQNSEKLSAEAILELDDYKTGCLFKAALLTGMYIVHDEANYHFYVHLAQILGRIFQIQDDLFDVTKTTTETGKPALSDLKNHKATLLALCNVAEIQNKLDNEFRQAFALIEGEKRVNPALKELFMQIQRR